VNKAELIATVSEKLEIPKKQVKAVVEAVFETVGETLERGEEVKLLPDFGVFKVVERSERTGRNPQTGKKIKIPAKKVVRFKAAKRLEERVK
jgi:nucleoid DNA-binding protein